jgi:predicted short-subunit dehydrogenase-like oxidoreductase (DUF2520 family)
LEIQKIAIIGQGNVAYHYQKIMLSKGLDVEIIPSRQPFDLGKIQRDLIIIAVKDDAISEIVDKIYILNHRQRLTSIVVHTSGYTETKYLAKISNRYGSFYPLQSLRKGVEIDFSAVPLCVWANEEDTLKELHRLATKLTKTIYVLDDNQRKSLHLAAVFSNNFTNHLFYISKTILDKANIPFETLFPLIDRTTQAIKENNPYDLQTGPAVRGDYSIMNNHKNQLEDRWQEIYNTISESIVKEHR